MIIKITTLAVLMLSIVYFVLFLSLKDNSWFHKKIANGTLLLLSFLLILVAPFVLILVPDNFSKPDNFSNGTSINENPNILDYHAFPKHKNKGILVFKLSGDFETVSIMTEKDDYTWTNRNADSIVAIVLPVGKAIIKNVSFEKHSHLGTYGGPVARHPITLPKKFVHRINLVFNIEKGKVTYLGNFKLNKIGSNQGYGTSIVTVNTNNYVYLNILNYDTIIIKDLVEWDLHGKLKRGIQKPFKLPKLDYTRSIRSILDTPLFINNTEYNYAVKLANEALDYNESGNFKIAIELLKEALELLEIINEKYTEDYVIVLSELAYTYNELKDYEKAVENWTELRELYEIMDKQNSDYAIVLLNLAYTYYELEDYEKAVEYWTELRELYEIMNKQNSEDYELLLWSLADTYYELEDYEKAVEYWKEVLEILKKLDKENSKDYAIVSNNIGKSFSNLRNFKQAEIYLMQSLKTDSVINDNFNEKRASENHFVTLKNMALLYFETEKMKLAEQYTLKAYDLFKNKDLEPDSIFINNLNALASYYIKTEVYEKAEKILLETSEIVKNYDVENDTIKVNKILINLNALASFYIKTEVYNKAEKLLLETSEIVKKYYGENDTINVKVNKSLINLYNKTGEIEKSDEYIYANRKIRKQQIIIYLKNNAFIITTIIVLFLIITFGLVLYFRWKRNRKIIIYCPNGHKLRFKYTTKKIRVKCPKCNTNLIYKQRSFFDKILDYLKKKFKTRT